MTRINFKNLPDTTTPITGENLNKLNNLAIDTSVGEHEEEVVLLEPKNLIGNATFTDKIFLYAGGNIGYNSSGGEITYVLPIKESTKYTISRTSAGTRFRVATYTTDSITTTTTPTANVVSDTSTSITIESGTNDKYLFINVESKIISSLQVELGSTKTDYEAPKKTEIYANAEKYTDTLNIGVEPNNSGVWVEHSDNVLPLTGINSTFNGMNVYSKDGNIYINGNGTTAYVSTIKLKEFTLKKGTYTTEQKSIVENISSFIRKSSDNSLLNESNRTFTLSEDTLVYLCLYAPQKNYSNLQLQFRINIGNELLDYEPYTEPSIKVNNNGVYEDIYSKHVVLWTNSSPTSEFAGQTITVSDNFSNYKYFEIIYKSSTNGNIANSTGKVPTNNITVLNYMNQYIWRREITGISTNRITFDNCGYYTTYGNSNKTTSNGVLIPLQILGYKD